ncbi:MAG: Ig-like domain-containing protein, partial [Desulfotomaculaceae bacterium]|nr:Ig-like domain-containing protein [Desulfotomaculaceae bacterium]
TWTQESSGTSQWLSGITWNASQFVVVGDSGIVLTSPNGNTWTPQDSTVTYQCLQDVTWNGEQFIAVGTFGVILTSIDGCAWNQQKVGSELRGVATNGTQVLVVGDSGTILQSEYEPDKNTFSDPKLWPAKTDVSLDKSWTIRFNMPVDESKINDQSIFISDQNENILQSSIIVNVDSVQILPNAPYNPGQTYYLNIGSSIQSRSGKMLQKSVKMPFTTKLS